MCDCTISLQAATQSLVLFRMLLYLEFQSSNHCISYFYFVTCMINQKLTVMNKLEFDLKGQDVTKLSWLLSNGQVVMLTCCNAKRSIYGIITLAWMTPTSHIPLLITVSVGNGGIETGEIAYRYCYSLINETKEFGLNIPTPDLKEAIAKVGTTHSNEIDKFDSTGLTKMPSSKINTPMINECFLNVECKVLEQYVTGDHTVFVAEPVAAFMNEDAIADGKFSEKYYDKKNQLQIGEFVTMWDMW